MLFGLLAYTLWGAFPAFFPLLKPAAPVEIIAHRIIWTALFMALVLLATGKWRELRAAPRGTWWRIACAGFLIAVNWLVYVIAVNSNHVADAALGYFINPLVSVLFGVIFLSERLRPLQRISIAIAAAAVCMLAVIGGHPPIYSLLLAFSFALYGLVKKQVRISALASVAAEAWVVTPAALAYLAYLHHTGANTFATEGTGHALLLMSSGVVTAVPLLLFSLAAQRIRLSTIGMLQYLTPTLQMLWAVFVVHETLSPLRWLGFVVIWVSVALYLADLGLQRGRDHKPRQTR